MFLKWLDATEAKKFGIEMAELIRHRSPIEAKDKQQERLFKNAEKRHEATLVLVEKRLSSFKKSHPLNVYTKAQLGSSFKYALLDSGYNPDFCNNTTTWLLLQCK